jgi:hypothetical protein
MSVRAHVRGNAVGYIALFVALGGTSYAAVNLPAGSVGSKQLKRAAVTGPKIAKNAVRSRNVKDLLAEDFKPGQLPAGARGSDGAAGAKGETGAPGLPGLPGAPGPTASAYASHAPDVAVVFRGGEYTQVIELGDKTNGRNSGGVLTVPFTGRILVSATVQLVNLTSVEDTAACYAAVATASSGWITASRATSAPIQAHSSIQLPIVGAYDMSAPGTFHVQIACTGGKDFASLSFYNGDLIAWAAAS